MARRLGSPRYREDRRGWYLSFTHDGRRVQRKVASASSPDNEAAQRQAERVRDEVQRRVERGQPLEVILQEVFGDLTGHKLTFRDAAPAFLQYRESRRKPSTYRNDVSRLRVLCRAPWAGKYLAAITANDLMKWVNRRKSGRKAVSGATTNRDLALCSALFRWAQSMGFVSDNPVRVVERDSERGRARTTWLTVPECQALIESAEGQFRVVLLCLLHAGLRRGELLKLEWRSVDLERGELVVEPESAKTGRVRHVPLTERLAAELTLLREASEKPVGPVFRRGDGRTCTEGWLRHWLSKALAACDGITDERKDKVSLHVLRHTFASHLAQEGVALHEIGYLLGHSTAYVTERYAHLAPGAGRSAISILGRRFDGDGASNVSDVLSPYQASRSPGVVPIAYPDSQPQAASA